MQWPRGNLAGDLVDHDAFHAAVGVDKLKMIGIAVRFADWSAQRRPLG